MENNKDNLKPEEKVAVVLAAGVDAALIRVIADKFKDSGVGVVDADALLTDSCSLEAFLQSLKELPLIPTGLSMRLQERLRIMQESKDSVTPLHKSMYFLQGKSGPLDSPTGIACTVFANQSKISNGGSAAIDLEANTRAVMVTYENTSHCEQMFYRSWLQFMMEQEEFYIGEVKKEETEKEKSQPWKKKNRLSSVTWNNDQKAQKKKELLAKMAQSKTIRMKK